MQASYNIYLVVLSYFIASYASYATLTLSKRLIKSDSKIKWLLGGSATLGCGIWSMHFIGMLAYEMQMPMSYDFALTSISGFIALLSSALGMYLLGWKKLCVKRILIGGLVMGLGIASMHYIGMEAMIMPATIRYQPLLFTVSVLIAIAASIAALFIAHNLAHRKNKHHDLLILIAALIMGVAIAGMHYVGMAAAVYTPIDNFNIQIDDFDNTILIGTISFISLLIITAGLFASNNKPGKHQNNTILLVLTITTAITVSVGITIETLYNTAFTTTKFHLIENLENHKKLIRAVTKFDATHSRDDHKEGARAATISQIKEAHANTDINTFDNEFFLFEFSNNKQYIKFLIAESLHSDLFPAQIAADSPAATLFKKALYEKSGAQKLLHMITKNNVLAAYTFIPELNAGLLGTVTIEKVRQPFINALMFTAFISFFVIVIAAIITMSINTPVIRKLKDEIDNRNKTEDELRQLTNNLEAIVNERTIELKQALIIAEDAAKSKGEFLANMSHEIRTPMNGVLGMLQLLSETKMNIDQKDFVSTAYKSAETLLTILNDILDFSKIEAGAIELEHIDFNLHEAIEDVAALLAESAHKKELELITHVSTNVPVMIKGDPTRLRQILFNLTSNAIKFTEQGEIVISAKLDNKTDDEYEIRFEVSDTGMGISKEGQTKIFEVFKQEDGSTTRNFGGTGLGLTISKKLTQCMGGDLSVRSSQGAGSTFYFSIKTGTSAIKPSTDRDHGSLQHIDALIVDDNKTNRKILESMLTSWNIRHESAEDGTVGLKMIAEKRSANKPYDLIILDMMMPGMNGLEVADKLQKENSKSKIIMLTSMTNANIQEQSKAAGISACTHKPVKKSLLLDTIMATLHEESDELTAGEIKLFDEHESVDLHDTPILVAEDNLINQKVVSGMLRKLGYPFEIANNGQEAVDAVTSKQYAMVLMDCQMPVMDGYIATKTIRKNESTKGTIIIAMTANAMEGDREHCINSGMDDYISKPLNKAALSAIIKKSLPVHDTKQG